MTTSGHDDPPDLRDVRYVFRPWRRCPSTGRKIWARQYGFKAWRIPVQEDGSDHASK